MMLQDVNALCHGNTFRKAFICGTDKDHFRVPAGTKGNQQEFLGKTGVDFKSNNWVR